MKRINDLVKPETMTIKTLKDQFNSGIMYVDDSFQRRYVWLRKNQIKLIETILKGFIIPEIFIWDQETDPDTGESKRSIVDGQQRIRSIVDFINGEYSLTKAHLDDQDASYAGKSFSNLDPEDKKLIWDYSLSVQRIQSSVTREEVINIFLRLNSTDKSLNPQELRNAEYNGLFLQNAIQISNNPFWSVHKVFSPDLLRRMGDVEFVSSLLIFLRKGINSELTQNSINNAYDLFNEKYDEMEEDKHTIEKILAEIDRIVLKDCDHILDNYISKTAHLYTFVVTLYGYLVRGNPLSDIQIERLLSFYKCYENSSNEKAQEYKKLLLQGTRSKPNRMNRMRILQGVIEGKIHIE